MSKRRTRTTLVVAFVVMGVAVLGLAAAVYAKYIASITDKTASAEVAKWAFEEENTNATLTCDPTASKIKEGTLVNGKIAPGTEGTCEIELKNTRSDVGVNVTVTLKKLSGPANLVFKNGNTTLSQGDTLPVVTLGLNETKTISIDWKWEYSTSDANDTKDTADGKKAAGDTSSNGVDKLEATFDVSGVQVDPRQQ